MSPPTEHEELERVADLGARGLFFSAHDRAIAALAGGLDSEPLRHAAVLNLARAGATSSALALLRRWRLGASHDPEFAGLYPRLLKDVALRTGRAVDAAAAAAAYAALWQRFGGGWLGVNAAAMALLAGDRARAAALAAEVGHTADTGTYWSAATLAEAALLQADQDGASAWLAKAEARAGEDLAQRAVTRRQLRWEAARLGLDPACADALVIPATVHFCGQIPGSAADETALRGLLEQRLAGVGFGFGSLAAGADIVIAETLIARGADLTVVLPFPPEEFVARSVRPAGATWVPRFEACLARARIVRLEDAPQDDLDYGLTSRRAMGLARLHAERLESAAWQLAIWDGGGNPEGLAGTAADVATWRRGGRTEVIDSPWPRRAPGGAAAPPRPPRQPASVLFGDLPGFGRLGDAALAAFYEGPMALIGGVVDAAGPLYRNAWGDAVQLVFADATDAARCALALRDVVTEAALEGFGLPTSLIPRLALDFGGLHRVFDPVQGATKFAGRVMTRAARIEPVTPPGTIYATEAFACELALAALPSIACDYAGMVPTAKAFGDLPLFAVRSRGVST